jgi:sugar-specific transcriptional regulator TrmB
MEILKEIGLSENEVKIYLYLLKAGAKSAYEIGKHTGIYRVHVYDKLEQLSEKGLVSHIYEGAKKHYKATNPERIGEIVEERLLEIKKQEKEVKEKIKELKKIQNIGGADTSAEIFRGKEGIKFMLKDIIKTRKEVLISGINDAKYDELLGDWMEQYFRDLRNYMVKERFLTTQSKEIFKYSKKDAPTTTYRYLESDEYNPTNTFIYGDKVVIVCWETPVTAVMIKNKKLAKTYRQQFEQLWKNAKR